MQELELTWGRVAWIWWGLFWRWVVFANLIVGAYAGFVGIILLLLGHRDWASSPWLVNGILVALIPAAIIALKLSLKAKYKKFRLVLIAPPQETKLQNE